MLLSIGQSTSFCAWATIEAGLRLSSSGQRLFGVYRIMWTCSCASKWVVVVAVLALAKLSALCGRRLRQDEVVNTLCMKRSLYKGLLKA